jgi:ribosome-dependent ATPase
MNLQRLGALIWRETTEVLRDLFRFCSALAVPAVLMTVFSLGLTLDVENLSYATFDRDRSPSSRTYLEGFAHSRYFVDVGAVSSDAELERRFAGGELRFAIEIPPNFGRDLASQRMPQVAYWIDGTMPFRAETIRGYIRAMNVDQARRYARENSGVNTVDAPMDLRTRFWFNQGLQSKFAFIPGILAMVLALSPAMLTAVAVVREKELGSITNLYATPTGRVEFLLGKQLPYVAISMANFGVLTGMTIYAFGVPLKGDFLTLTFGAVLYVFVTTGIGLLVSSFTRTQLAALLISLIVTVVPSFLYSGLMTPVSSLVGGAAWVARGFPAAYFLNIAVGCFAKNLPLSELWPNYAVLSCMAVIVLGASVAFLRKQDR